MSAEMKTGLWFWNARRHLFSWQNCTSLQKISGLPEKTQAWKTCKIKIQRLTSSNNHNYSRSDSPVWQTYVQCKGELIPCTRHYSVLRTIVHSVGHASKRGPAIQVSMVISRTFSYYSRYMPACVLSTKLSILEDAADLSRDFHTSSRDLALPIPLLWILLKPVKKLTAMLLGRSIRKWWQALPPEKQDLLKDYVKRNKWRILFGVCSLSCLIAIYFWTHLDKNPITGRTRLLMFSKRQFLQLAEFEYQSVLESYKDKILPVTDPMYKTTQFILNQLVEKNKDIPGVSETTWSINVVDDPEINAFVMPNGQVFVLTGLFKAVADTDQLACILGHEMAHCLLAHGAEHASIIQLLDFVCLVFLTLIWATFPRDSLAALGQWIQKKLIEYMFDRPYSRKLEFEADEVGLRLAAKACIDVRASSVYWQQLELMKIVSGTFQIPEWFSTHPSNDHRVEHLEKLMPQAIKLREDCSCPSLPSVDPRLVFKLSMQEILKVSKKREEAICSDSETKHLSQCFEPSPAMIEKIPIVVPVQALQSTQSTHK
ncbi:metalloendopeptidase OMA1, mitochondrial isoform X2 [Stegostoma tigrinum]|uniref:metalloendopeptidase OMA1, mitochondrial isoform X2 n=1 Tax=Stegostoma tigrinum TaxID=3053191 RepID=UPI00202B09B8|nr:metalloendopeptidase OMA1, mitochondrial isoform X2 [Stegostoma tigrinum]